jgi:hypothetical protein
VAEGTPRRGKHATRRRRFAIALLVAILLHVPFTPLVVAFQFLRFLNFEQPAKSSWDYKDDEVVIPITLEDSPESTPAKPPSPPVAELAPGPSGGDVPVKPGATLDAGASDAGAVDAGDGGADAGARRRDAGAADAGDAGDADAGRAKRPPPDGGAAVGVDGGVAALPKPAPAESSRGPAAPKPAEPAVKDALALTGSVKKIVKGKPNVSLAVWFSVVRDHPLGFQVGSLLQCNRQWKDFLGDDLDPVRDLDGLWLGGPRLTETSKVMAVVQHKLPQAKVHALLQAMIDRSGGSGAWVEDGPARLVAKAHADRADRIVFTHSPSVVLVAPPEGWEQLRDYKGKLGLPASKGLALALTMVTPWRPLRLLQIQAPETLSEMRLTVVATDDGGADVALELDDKDEAAAAADAKALGAAISDSPASLLLGTVEFQPNGSHFAAKRHLSRMQLGLLLGFAKGFVCPAPQHGALDAGSPGAPTIPADQRR